MGLQESQILNPIRIVSNGILKLGFDFSCNDNLGLVNICYETSTSNSYLVIDNIYVLDKNNFGDEYIVQYQSNFDDIVSNDVFNSTPFWCNAGVFQFANNNGNKAIEYSGYYYRDNGDNVALGGLTREELTTKANTLYYYSYDLKLEGIKYFVITTLDNRGTGQIYSEIKYDNSTQSFEIVAAGGIKNFEAIYDNGIYHISYNRLTSDYGKDEHYIYATSSENLSKVTIDNFVVAYKE